MKWKEADEGGQAWKEDMEEEGRTEDKVEKTGGACRRKRREETGIRMGKIDLEMCIPRNQCWIPPLRLQPL